MTTERKQRAVLDRCDGPRRVGTIPLGPLGVLLLVSVLVRFAVAVWAVPTWERRSNVAPFPDQYPTLAASLVAGNGLSYGFGPTSARGPGFPLFLAPAVALGINSPAGLGFWTSLSGIAAAIVAAAVAFAKAGPFAGWTTGVVLALHPVAAFTSARTMSDEFYGALTLVACVSFVRLLDRESSRWTWDAASAASLAWLLLTRSTGVLVWGGLLGATVFHGPPRRRSTVVLALSLVPALVWSVRSSQLEGRPVFVHSLTAYNFWFGEALDRGDWRVARAFSRNAALRLMAEEGGYGQALDSKFWYGSLTATETSKMEDTLRSSAARHIASDPLRYAGRVCRGLVWFWCRAESSGATLLYGATLYPLLTLGIFALRWSPRTTRTLVVVGMCVVALHNVAYAAVFPSGRMAVQVVPLLGLLAGVGLAGTLDAVRARRTRQ